MRRMYSKPQLLEAVEEESKLNGIKVFEDIVDKDGHDRFIEGEINFPTVEGLTKSYGKWSLSGTHLMFVVAGSVANGTVLTNKVFYTQLPQWIMDKIYPVFNDVLENKSIPFYSSDWSSQNVGFILNKQSANMQITIATATMTADRTFRAQFDLLIDNE